MRLMCPWVVDVTETTPWWGLIVSGLAGGLLAAGAALFVSWLERRAALARTTRELLRPLYTDLFLAASELASIAEEGCRTETIVALFKELPTAEEERSGCPAGGRPTPLHDRRQKAQERFHSLCVGVQIGGAPQEVNSAAAAVGRAFGDWFRSRTLGDEAARKAAEDVNSASDQLGLALMEHLGPLARV
jgi:hypothetical protein